MNEHATPTRPEEPFGGLSHEIPAQPEHISERLPSPLSAQPPSEHVGAAPDEFPASKWIPAAACLALASGLPFLEATKTANSAGPAALLGAIFLASLAKAQERKHRAVFAIGLAACSLSLAAIGWHAAQTWSILPMDSQRLLWAELQRRFFWAAAASIPLPLAARAPKYLSLVLYAASACSAAAMLFGIDFPWNYSR